MPIGSLQAVTEILSRMSFHQVQAALRDGAGDERSATIEDRRDGLHAPVRIALELSFAGIACAFGAELADVVAFIRPDCPNATADFSRVALLRPDRIWGGELLYICRVLRPISFTWQGPDPLTVIPIEGDFAADRLETSRPPHHQGLVPAKSIAPGATCMAGSYSTLAIFPSSITRLITHAYLAGIPLPCTSRARGRETSVLSAHPPIEPGFYPTWAQPRLSSGG